MPSRAMKITATLVVALAWIALAIAAVGGVQDIRPSIEAGGLIAKVAAQTSGLEQALRTMIASAPDVPEQVRASVTTALTPMPGERPLGQQALLILATLVMLSVSPLMLRVYVARRVSSEPGSAGARTVFSMLIADTTAILAVGLLAFLAVRVLFASESRLDRLAVGLIWGFVRWWVAMRVVDIVLRPRAPALRLVPASDRAARGVVRLLAIGFGLGIWFIAIAPVLLGGGLEAPAARTLAVAIGLVESMVLLLATRRLFLDEPRPPQWLAVALRSAILGVAVIWTVSVLALEFSVYRSVILCLEVAGVALVADRLLAVGSQDLAPAYGAAVRRVIWFATIAVVVFSAAKLILTKLVHTTDPEALASLDGRYTRALLIIVAGLAVFEVTRAISIQIFGAGQPVPDPNDEQLGKPVSRMATVVPIAVGIGGAIVIITSLIMALSELGVSVAPLIAGVGILGLAFSFGSQALVRDIVAGMFYLIEDAFRVGEYIDTGRHKGTVEKITLRSLRLRHQNGQFHNVPYGQFGAVTNFSRDWTTMKFNLRLARDTDIEKIRKLTKAVGQQMLEHPEVGKDFIVPLKLQGLIDIQENALVLRFKFTIKPNEPTIVRREVMKKLFQVFREQGVTFASHVVTVQSGTSGNPEEQAAAASQVAAMPAPVPDAGRV